MGKLRIWRERGSDRADRVGDPAPGCRGDTSTLGLDNQIKLRVKLRRKVSRRLLQAPVQLERIPCPLMAIITNIWGS